MEKRSTTEMDKIQAYCELLIKWNEKINLIGRATMENIMERHVLDCLQLSDFLPDKKEQIADLGTGAGLPGIVLSIIGYKNVTLIESDQKKCVFLREVRRSLGIEFTIIDKRIEDVEGISFDVLTSRAMASLDLLFDLGLPLLKEEGRCVFMKGVSYNQEIDLAKQRWTFDCRVTPSKTGCGGVILEVQNIGKKITTEE